MGFTPTRLDEFADCLEVVFTPFMYALGLILLLPLAPFALIGFFIRRARERRQA
jgi:hypothetical protein